MDHGETQEVSTLMEFSHPPVEGHDRCETTPHLMQEDPAIGLASHRSSCEATSTLPPITSGSSPRQPSVLPTMSSEILSGSVSSPCPIFRRKYASLQREAEFLFLQLFRFFFLWMDDDSGLEYRGDEMDEAAAL
uniref:Uncharacterized protein n=1 Tax=Chenopodium quinoa TaxID=63459 RepID=A0A803N3N0_CHEQI